MSRELPMAPIVAPAEESLEQLAAAANACHEAGESATRKGLEQFRAAGESLLKAKKRCRHGEWLPWLAKNVRFDRVNAWRYMLVAREWEKCCGAKHLADAIRLLTANGEEQEPPAPSAEPEHITLERWGEMTAAQRKAALSPASSTKKFNDQGDNENIEWALWSWNPVTGCEHNCPYCYARDMATSGPIAGAFPNGFAPTVIPSRLLAPRNTTFPEAKAAEWMGHKNVFTCSMADLFGRWVPREWIDAVLDAVRAAPQWNFLFLTKFPVRMAEFDFPDNAWVGTSVDCQARVANAERSFRKVRAKVKWLSCEPMIEPLKFSDLGAFQWVVIGGASRSTQTPEWVPPYRWVSELTYHAWDVGARVYHKSNLGMAPGARVREYPGVEPAQAAEAPEALRYLAKVERS